MPGLRFLARGFFPRVFRLEALDPLQQPHFFSSLLDKLGSKGLFLPFKKPLCIFRCLMSGLRFLDRKPELLRLLRYHPPVIRRRFILLFGRLRTFARQLGFFKKSIFLGFQCFYFVYYF